jgi:hypothetical protein
VSRIRISTADAVGARLSGRRPGNRTFVIRKLLWSALYAVLGAAATMAARRAASSIWRATTHEEPPAKR